MAKSRRGFNLIVIIVLAFLCFNFIYPQGINKGISFIKPKVSGIPVLSRLTYFPERNFKLGLDLQGGSHLVYEADLSAVEGEEQGEAMEGLRDVIERRVNLFGVGEPMVAIQEVKESRRLVVELPGIKDVNEAIRMIGETPYLEFKEERDEEERDELLKIQEEFQAEIEEISSSASTEVLQAKFDEFAATYEDPYFRETKLTGQYLSKAVLSFDQTTMVAYVVLEFDDEGKELFSELTKNNVGKRLAIVIDQSIISAPVVREEITGGTAQITGDFTVDEAKELVRNLNAGALPVPIGLISQTSVGPTLGRISMEKSLKAGIFGFLMVCLFMLIFYRLSGLLAGLSLLIYAGILLSLFKLIPVTLTLAGIGGAVLSVGMAVDANVLIFERIKEERITGDSFQSALRIGFARAWTSIRDSNITTLLVAVIMFSFGSGFVKGFALTLSLGILVSIFSAMFVTKTFLRLFEGTKLENNKWLWR
ncbi:MAG: protein translocase subunit SecD [Parcubacteria group bacterium]|nr:protein translocase subunit SecD [Parcubacteria group bacterium]